MKKIFAVVLATIMVMAVCPLAFAEWIELDEIYDTYGYGEEIYVGGRSQTEGVIVSLVDPNGYLKYYVALDAQTLEAGVYIGVDKTWDLGEYILRVSYGTEYIDTHYITVQEERVNRNPVADNPVNTGTSGNKTVITATDISVSETDVKMELGETVELTAKGEKASYKWVTDDSDKIKIEGVNSANAKITAKKTGKAVVWVYCGNNYSTVEITISPVSKPQTDNTEKKPEADMFTDIADVEWAKESINALAKAGVINGMGEGIFAPKENVTRAQFVKMIVEGFGFEGKGDVSFTDIAGDEWYADVVLVAANNGIVNGYDGRFSPNSNISCRDAALIISRVLAMKNIELKNAPSDKEFDGAEYAAEAVKLLAGNGIIDDKMGFESLENATRAQSAYLIYGAYMLK